MSIFAISDLHLSLGVNKPMDVFGGRWENYVEKLDEQWRSLVSPGDTVIIPGDISWAINFAEAIEDFRFINNLPGKKIIMKGNHDLWWSSSAKFRSFLDENGFDSIAFLKNNALFIEDKLICGSRGWMCEDKMTEADKKILDREAIRFGLSLADADRQNPERNIERIVFSHYPVCGDYYRQNPILNVLVSAGISRVYYGHLHGVDEKKLIGESEGISLNLIASDYLSFTPMKIE